MDPVSIASGAAGLAVVVANLVQKTMQYSEQVASADSTLRHLASELATLETTLASIGSVLKKSDLESAFGKATTSKEMSRHMSALQQILDDCKVAVDEFEALLESLKASRFTSSILRKSTTAWKINQKTPQLIKLQHLISGYHRALQIHLQLMTLLLSTETAVGLQNVDSSLDSIKAEILRLRFHLTSVNDDESLDGKTLTSNSIKQSLTTSEHVLTSASEYFGSTAGTIRMNNTSPVNFSDDRAANVQQWIQREHEDRIDEAASEDDEDTEMISDLAETAKKKYTQGDYPNARRFFSTFLEKVDSQPAWDRDEIVNAQVKLAACYASSQEYDHAHVVLEKTDTAGCSPQQTSQVQLSLAEILYLKVELEKAKRYARLAMKSQDKDTPPYYNSVTLLVLICNDLGQAEEAEVYKARIPDSFQPQRLPGWSKSAEAANTEENSLSSHILTTEQDASDDVGVYSGPTENGLVILNPLHEEMVSERTSTPTDVTFFNRTKSTRISIYWVDWEKNSKHYIDVGAGYSSQRPTYIGHVWLVLDCKTRRVIASYVAQKQPAAAIITDEMALRPLERGVPSGRSSKATNLLFVNRTRGTLDVYWLDWDGQAKHYVTLAPDATSRRPTYTGHVWKVRVRSGDVPIACYMAPIGDATVIINEEQRLKALGYGAGYVSLT